mgnify:CR=1 FL=1
MRQFNLEAYLKNPNQKIVTRTGNPVRIICTNRKNEKYPIVALVQDSNGNYEDTYHYTINGEWSKGAINPPDLLFVPEKKEGWINIYKTPDEVTSLSEIYTSKEVAEASAKNCVYYITTTKIEWEE